MSGAKQRTALTNLNEPQQIRELNRQLSWIWDRLLGGLELKSLSADARGVIESKMSSADMESAIRQSEDEILLEVKKPASAVDTGNGIVINEKGVEISAGDGSQYIRITDEMIEATDIRSETVSPRYAGEMLLTVDPSATAEQMQAWGVYRSLADALSAVSGRQLEGRLQINIADGAAMYGDVELTGVCGGEIEINGTDVMQYGSMTISGCSCSVYINRMSITAAEGNALSVSGGSSFVSIWASTLSAAAGSALYASAGARVKTAECTLISASASAAFVFDTAFGNFVNCIGTGALAVQFAALAAMGTVPDGGCEDWGGSLTSWDGVVPTGAGGQPSVPETITASYAMLHSDSYRGGWSWYEDNDIRQGYISSGRIRGCMWFDNDVIRAALAGKTINQASLSLYAMKGVGRGVAVSVELYGTTSQYSSRFDSAPALTTSYGTIGSVTPGEVTTITIPTQAVSDLVAGTINALMVYSSDTTLHGEKDYSRNYARFAGETSGDESTVPMLTVVASGGSEAAGYTNQIPISTDTSGNIYNGVGYKADTYLSGGADGTKTGIYATGFIPCVYGDIIRFANCQIQANQSDHRFAFYDADKVMLSNAQFNTTQLASNGGFAEEYGSDGSMTQMTLNWSSLDSLGCAYMRLCCGYLSGDSVITVGEEIT